MTMMMLLDERSGHRLGHLDHKRLEHLVHAIMPTVCCYTALAH